MDEPEELGGNQWVAARGCSVIFVNDRGDLLLYLRDDRTDIPEPGKWDLIGGQVEAGETPEEAIVREVKEELDFELRGHRFYRRTTFPDRIEYTFCCRLNQAASDITLNEGQQLRWFSPTEILRLDLAFGFNHLVAEFLE